MTDEYRISKIRTSGHDELSGIWGDWGYSAESRNNSEGEFKEVFGFLPLEELAEELSDLLDGIKTAELSRGVRKQKVCLDRRCPMVQHGIVSDKELGQLASLIYGRLNP